MTAYEFSQPWLDALNGRQANTAKEFAHLRSYLAGIDNGSISLFNPKFLNATIVNLNIGGNVDMNGFKLTDLGAGSANGDSLRYEQVIGVYLPLAGGTMAGVIAMGSNKITGLAAATANGDAVRFEQLSAAGVPLTYRRRPVLQYGSATTVAVEYGTDGTSTNCPIVFPDGELRTETSTTRTTFDITRNAVLTTSGAQSGLTGSTSEATNTWYALYAVKVTDSSTLWVTVGSTVLPLVANFATLNTAYGTDGWVYLGLIRNGDNAGATGDILDFVQDGNETIFQNATNATAATFAGVGTRLATTAGATALTYTYSAGTGATNIPANIGHANFQACFATVTGKLVWNAANSILYQIAGAASAVSHVLVRVPATDGIQLQNGPGSSIAYTIQLAGFTDIALGVGANPLI